MTRIISREDWIPWAPRYRTPAVHAGKPAVVHWFGPGARRTGTQAGIDQCLGFAEYHAFNLGWADFAYNWAIIADENPSGQATILEGRGRNVRGAHSGDNVGNGCAGIMLLAGTQTPAPTGPQIAALHELAAREDLVRYTGHLEWSPTSCPGPIIQPWILKNRTPPPAKPTYPYGASLRVAVNGRTWSGTSSDWGKALYVLRHIAKKGLKPQAQAAIAWRGNVWRKAPGESDRTVQNVARSLLVRFDGGWR